MQLVLVLVAVLGVGAVGVALAQGDDESKPESITQIDAVPASESCPKADAVMVGPYPVSSFVQHCPSAEELDAIFAYVDAGGFNIDELRQGCIEDLAFTGPCRDESVTQVDAVGLPASECPEAAAILEAGGRPVDSFYPDCPGPDELERIVHDALQFDGAPTRAEFLQDCIDHEVFTGPCADAGMLETVAPPRGEICDESGRCVAASECPYEIDGRDVCGLTGLGLDPVAEEDIVPNGPETDYASEGPSPSQAERCREHPSPADPLFCEMIIAVTEGEIPAGEYSAEELKAALGH